MKKGREDADRDILILIAAVAASNYADDRKHLVPKFFLPAIEALTELGDAGWLNAIWYRKEGKSILEGLDEKGREVILAGLLRAENIDYQAEELLIPIANSNPGRIISFFGDRIRFKDETKPEGRYDAIPFNFHKLHEILAKFPDIAVDTVRLWFDGNEALFQYRGANLLKIIFPDFRESFSKKLLELVKTGDRQNVDFVLSVLRNYEGEPFLHEICKEIVAALPEEDDLLPIVSIVLESTSVVTGEFGFAEAYERKIEEIKPWLSDENEAVRVFAADYVSRLGRAAEFERRRAEEDIQLRKHAFGVREPADEEQAGGGQQGAKANEGDSENE